MRYRLGAAAALLVLTACAGPSHPAVSRSAAGTPMRTYLLAAGAELHAWVRSDRRGAPWLLYVHGGSWRAGQGDSPTAVALAAHELRRGFQVFSVDYRLSQDARWPAQREDVAAAVDRIRARASDFGIAAGRGVVLGESAGGQLAAVEASRGRVAGLVDLAGVVDPVAARHAPLRRLGEAADQLVGCAPATCASRWRDTQAISHVGSRTPPSLVLHSIADPVVPVSMSRAFAAELRADGRPVTLRVVAGRAHSLLFEPVVLRAVDAFVDRVTATG